MITVPRILTPNNVTVLVSGRPSFTTPRDSALGQRILELLRDPEATEADLAEVLADDKPLAKYVSDNGDFVISENGAVTYQGEALPDTLANRIYESWEAKVPFAHLERFFMNLWANPSMRARKELYKFLEHENLPITERGTFLAYKGVNEDGWSKTGNTSTKVLQGVVDMAGRILNCVGAVIEVERRCVNDDASQGCAEGLHVGALKYAVEFGPRCLIVEVNPADVVSVPLDSSFMKVRTVKYRVVDEYRGPLPKVASKESGAYDGYEKPDLPDPDEDEDEDPNEEIRFQIDQIAKRIDELGETLQELEELVDK